MIPKKAAEKATFIPLDRWVVENRRCWPEGPAQNTSGAIPPTRRPAANKKKIPVCFELFV